ncbi:putative retrotransposon protein [Tanacetum coccineum]
MDGNIHTYKARLVAKGFTQTYGVDYEEAFSPVTDIKSIRTITAMLAFYDYEIWQMDVKTAFLNGHLYEDMDASKRGSLLMKHNVELSKTQGPSTPAEVKRMKGVPYSSVVGSIMYTVRCTGPDVAHVSVYGGDSATELSVTCYTHVGWEIDRDDIRSHTGYVFVMNRGAVDRKSSKQSTTAMSSIEAEYIAASEAVMEAIWICKFTYGLGIVPNNDRPMDMYCDSTGAITIANEPGV